MHVEAPLPFDAMDAARERVEAGAAALTDGDWGEARQAFEAALGEDGDDPDALYGLGAVLWWTGRMADALPIWERAYSGFRRRSDPIQAVIAAVNLSLTYGSGFGNRAAAHGWVVRAERVASDVEAPPLRGWVLITKAQLVDEPSEAQAMIRTAQEIANECNDTDLELCALAALGASLIDEGRVHEAKPLLDEAMAGTLGGEFEELDTVVFTSCVLVQSCYRCADFSRVVQWVRALRGFIDRYGNPYVNSLCRAHYGAVLVATGDWAPAEVELGVALEMAGDAFPSVRAEASSFLAELRLAQGRPEEALRLLEEFEDQVVAAHVVAAAKLATGDAAGAAAVAARVLTDTGGRRLNGARAAEVLGEAHVMLGDPGLATVHGRRLVDLGNAHDCDLVTARGERLLGRTDRTSGAHEAARAHLEAAIAAFTRLEMPYESARTRMLLAEALEGVGDVGAVEAARHAFTTFESLGAARDADAAAAWLRVRGGAPARTGAPGGGALTRREREVLELLGEGRSNPEIADCLYLSRRTVEHHVASILSKLGLRNRTEAATHVLRDQRVPEGNR